MCKKCKGFKFVYVITNEKVVCSYCGHLEHSEYDGSNELCTRCSGLKYGFVSYKRKCKCDDLNKRKCTIL